MIGMNIGVKNFYLDLIFIYKGKVDHIIKEVKTLSNAIP